MLPLVPLLTFLSVVGIGVWDEGWSFKAAIPKAGIITVLLWAGIGGFLFGVDWVGNAIEWDLLALLIRLAGSWVWGPLILYVGIMSLTLINKIVRPSETEEDWPELLVGGGCLWAVFAPLTWFFVHGLSLIPSGVWKIAAILLSIGLCLTFFFYLLKAENTSQGEGDGTKVGWVKAGKTLAEEPSGSEVTGKKEAPEEGAEDIE